MIKNKKGITLISLVITIIVLLIIAGISISTGYDTITQVQNKKVETELSNVQQAIFQRYTMLENFNVNGNIPSNNEENNVEKEVDDGRPEQLVGIRIVDTSTLDSYGFTTYKIQYNNEDNKISYEEYYYMIDRNDFNELEIDSENESNAEYQYIVNYSTGEVFDLVNKIYINEYDESLGETITKKEDAALTGTGSTNKIEVNEYTFTDDEQ